MQQVNFDGFLSVLINLVWSIVNLPPSASASSPSYGNSTQDNLELVEHAMYLLASSVVSRPDLLKTLFHFEAVPLHTFLSKSLTCSNKVCLLFFTTSLPTIRRTFALAAPKAGCSSVPSSSTL